MSELHTNFTLPEGTYYIGDPCYVIEDKDLWEKCLASSEFFRTINHATINDITFYASSTGVGDGLFEDEIGNHYPVDSGLLSIIPIQIYMNLSVCSDESEAINILKRYGTVITTKEEIFVELDYGTFHFYNNEMCIYIYCLPDEDNDEDDEMTSFKNYY